MPPSAGSRCPARAVPAGSTAPTAGPRASSSATSSPRRAPHPVRVLIAAASRAGRGLPPDCQRWATARPAARPGALPPAGGRMASVGRPLRASSHAITELEVHISPVSSSSRPRPGSKARRPGRADAGPGVGRRSGAAGSPPPRQRRRCPVRPAAHLVAQHPPAREPMAGHRASTDRGGPGHGHHQRRQPLGPPATGDVEHQVGAAVPVPLGGPGPGDHGWIVVDGQAPATRAPGCQRGQAGQGRLERRPGRRCAPGSPDRPGRPGGRRRRSHPGRHRTGPDRSTLGATPPARHRPARVRDPGPGRTAGRCRSARHGAA
jgi:hypothetical protein